MNFSFQAEVHEGTHNCKVLGGIFTSKPIYFLKVDFFFFTLVWVLFVYPKKCEQYVGSKRVIMETNLLDRYKVSKCKSKPLYAGKKLMKK